MRNSRTIARLLQVTLAASLLAISSGCKQPATAPGAMTTPSSTAAPTDQQLSAEITSRLNSEAALSGQPIQLNVENGRATLNGTVADEASRSLASNAASSVEGVKTVINNLTVHSGRASREMAPEPASRRAAARNYPAPIAPPATQSAAPSQNTSERVKTVPPVADSRPVTRTVTLPAGTTVPVRMTETLETGKIQADAVFHGSLASDLTADGVTVIPRGANVTGRVVDAKDAGHYSGSSALTVELTQISANGRTIRLATAPYTVQGKGRGKNTAEKVGGGAALGAIIGALAGGGKGAAIGAGVGGGVGAGANTITRGQQVVIPSESVVNFRLQDAISVTTGGSRQTRSYDSGDTTQPDPTLQQR